MHPKKERTFVIIKPDGIQRSLVGEIIGRFERVGLKIVGMKFGMLDKDKIWKHYGKDIIRALEKFMTACPVVSLVLEGNQAVAVVTKMVGTTEPTTSDVGTIRGDLTLDSYQIAAVDDRAVRNLIHCSDTVENANNEIALWFEEKDLINYRIVSEAILYDINLDGILE